MAVVALIVFVMIGGDGDQGACLGTSVLVVVVGHDHCGIGRRGCRGAGIDGGRLNRFPQWWFRKNVHFSKVRGKGESRDRGSWMEEENSLKPGPVFQADTL